MSAHPSATRSARRRDQPARRRAARSERLGAAQILMACLLIFLGALASAPAAQAGGPTSVLATNYQAGRAGAAITGTAAYDQLVDALGVTAITGGQVAETQSRPPAGLQADAADIRLTWFIHDVTAWRLDGIHQAGLDIWVSTAEQFGEGSVYDVTPVWHKVANAKRLRATLIAMGVMVGDVDAAATTTTTSPDDVATANAALPSPSVATSNPPPTKAATTAAQIPTDSAGGVALGSPRGVAIAAAVLVVGFVLGRGRRPRTSPRAGT